MTKIEDQHYITKIIQGDTNAFAVLVDRYKDLVFTLAFKMLKNRDDAEEVSQDTFIKTFKSLQKFKGESKFSTWIYKITYNTCLDELKKKKKEQNVVSINEFTEHQVKTMENALAAIEDQERKQAIQDCLSLLPSDDSFLLNLFYFEDLSLNDIAQVMGITSNNVKIKLHRSRKRLASIFKEKLEPEIITYYESERR
ncbi:MAG: sigma-70 family RNA polymerase sigma factor [Flavobacteriaceae bacterium]|nr:sigma-70 family RNA polymerase sigma factor [Flavobacteriaceae bacterium]